ncbi:hypothetical protein TBLA_0F03250 [Henningerozyma blattae CBS 6284]|uniref:Serine/threonine-protein kinase MEC1 n=1 Tax=Henningerozyma blattae (strain ATCC 34711 / CBS 6284 / DSM 70876 / NBRC 10599 / NRRL Y-10934 / UCD 77-7) TaxID=1071380 RepID=I2H661_HENB6|nr:hypothetical protein TBLA_0F03250 [Tetrapisispora blattae CBS 6284]CCH61863.1 hypothetical protein TBLA_0F03250 [Tetrapisispora blattae CBS 6284]
METHLKYLEELSLAIKDSIKRQENEDPISDTNQFPPYKSNENGMGDSKSLKVLNTLLASLKDTRPLNPLNKNDEVFAKCLQVIDLLFQSRPYLIYKMIISFCNEILDISLLNFDNIHRLWLLRLKIGNACKYAYAMYGYTMKFKISEYLFSIVNTNENTLKTALNGNCLESDFITSLRKLYILSYWFCSSSSIFGKSLSFLDSSLGTDSWKSYFQSILRFVMYILDSVHIPSLLIELQVIRVRFLSVAVTMLSRTTLSIGDDPYLPFSDDLKYVLSQLLKFLSNNQQPFSYGDEIIAKCLYRTYILCTSHQKNTGDTVKFYEFFNSNFPISQFLNYEKISSIEIDMFPFSYHTNKALLLLYFDIHRRSADESLLKFNKTTKIWSFEPEGDEILNSIRVHNPIGIEQKQLENLHQSILHDFKMPFTGYTLKTSLARLPIDVPSKAFSSWNDTFKFLSKELSAAISNNSLKRQLQILNILGKISCCEGYHLNWTTNFSSWDLCPICDSNNDRNIFNDISPNRPPAILKSEIYNLVSESYFVDKSTLETDEILFASILTCLSRIFVHFQPPILTNSEDQVEFNDTTIRSNENANVFGLIAIAFRSSNRYIRILASKIIPLWNITPINNFEAKQMQLLLQFLNQNFSTNITETWLYTWTNLTLTTSGERFNSLILKLIDIFNSNEFSVYSGMSFQFRTLTRILHRTPSQLLSQNLPFLLKQYSKNLKERKVSFDKLINLLGFPANTVLDIYQSYIIPYAIIQHDTDVFGEIARIMCEANGRPINEQKYILLEKNSREIFAVALVKYSFFKIPLIKTLFTNRLPTFDTDIVNTGLFDFQTFAEVLKLYKNEENKHEVNDNNEAIIKRSLRFILTRIDCGTISDTAKNSIWSKELEIKYQNQLKNVILGVFQIFSVGFHDMEGRNSFFEQERVINGISYLLSNTSKETIISALAQISICLQNGLEIEEIRLKSMACWIKLLKSLSDEELSTVINEPVSFIFYKWSSFTPKERQSAYDILNELVNNHSDLVFKIKPSLMLTITNHPEVDMLTKNGEFARNLKNNINNINWIPILVVSLHTNNKYVISESLNDLEIYLTKNMSGQELAILSKSENGTNLADLLGALINVSSKYKNINDELCKRAAICIGMIGVLDLSVYHTNRSVLNEIKIYDLDDEKQTIKFLIWVLNDILVPLFWKSENPQKQLFAAFVMQESLKYCGLSCSPDDVSNPEEDPLKADLWNQFNTISKTTLYPLLSSLYLAQSWSNYESLVYPTNKFKEGYTIWIRSLTLDLLKISTNESHPLHVFSSLIREDDGSISQFLLPYICMNIMKKAEKNNEFEIILHNIEREFASIFNYTLTNLNHLQLDSMRSCFNAIFRVIEYCKKWVTWFKKEYWKIHDSHVIKETKTNAMLQRIETFIDSIPAEVLATKSLATNAFERSALYLEQSFRQKSASNVDTSQELAFLQKTYAEIGDLDSVDGMLKVFSTNSLSSKIEELQYSDSWEIAQDCYKILGEFSYDAPTTTKMLKIMYDHQNYLDVLESLDTLPSTIHSKCHNDYINWVSIAMESANLEGNLKYIVNWVERIENIPNITDLDVIFHYNIGKILLSIQKNQNTRALSYIQRSFSLLGSHFISSSTSMTSAKKENLLLKLHGLFDISLLVNSTGELSFDDCISTINHRKRRIGVDFSSNYYVLSLRKSFDSMKNQKLTQKDLIKTHLDIAKLSRNNSRVTIASQALMHCIKNGHAQAELEFAEILWKQGENDRALKLVKEIHTRNKSNPDVSSSDKAAILLKYTEWSYLSNSAPSTQIIRQYKQIETLTDSLDKLYYSMGLYYSRLLERKNLEGYSTKGSLEYHSVKYFLLAFQKNTVKIRETLPKVVTYWLDTADIAMSASKSNPNSSTTKALLDAANKICHEVSGSVKYAPTYIWYSVLTQLLSRLLHTHSLSCKAILHVIISLTFEYPLHLFWYVTPLLESASPLRVKRGEELANEYMSYSPSLKNIGQPRKLFTAAKELTKSLINVSMTKIQRTTRSGLRLEHDFDFNMKLAPTQLIVPVRINLELLSPTDSISTKTYTPFSEVVSIAKFRSQYKIFSSLKKPKQINVLGSNGMTYGIMCKREDVRQDNQYMQFATTMNFLLERDPNSMKRDLDITTYSVLSLREDCGLLEIVPNVTTLRDIYINIYSSMKVAYSIKSFYSKAKEMTSNEERIQFFLELRSQFFPVLYKWFLDSFPDPIDWFKARNLFSQSLSVMSMVGYMLGLGDRHCENILLDIETGKVLHVDFDCLFDKGKILPIPEIVPFRLTGNMVDALGVVGTEGTFKKSSEVTVKVVRENELALMNIIETIMYDRPVHDKLRNWSIVLRNKIRGLDARDGIILSVAAQVETLIQEATSEENLGMMYIGWLAFW